VQSKLICVILLGIVCWPAYPQDEETDRASDVRAQAAELYRLSGLEMQAKSVEPQFLEGLERGSSSLSDETVSVMRDVVRKQFADGAVENRARSIIVDRWNQEYGNRSLVWLHSDTGRRITAYEEYASTQAAMAGFKVFSDELEFNPPTEQRAALVRRLNDVYGGTDFAVDFTLALRLAVGVGLNAVSAAHEQLDLALLRKEVEGDREQLFAQIDQFLSIYNLYTYAELSDEEISGYIEFLESEAGNWYVDTLLMAATEPIVDLGIEIGVGLKDALGNKGDDESL
jgi:hypothetical protein